VTGLPAASRGKAARRARLCGIPQAPLSWPRAPAGLAPPEGVGAKVPFWEAFRAPGSAGPLPGPAVHEAVSLEECFSLELALAADTDCQLTVTFK
jgi:hypothetical protein